MSIPIALPAEHQIISLATNRNGLGTAVITDLGTEMLPREKISGVHMLVTKEAELGGIRSAVENRYLVAAEIAGNAPFSIRFGAPHVLCSLKNPRREKL